MQGAGAVLGGEGEPGDTQEENQGRVGVVWDRRVRPRLGSPSIAVMVDGEGLAEPAAVDSHERLCLKRQGSEEGLGRCVRARVDEQEQLVESFVVDGLAGLDQGLVPGPSRQPRQPSRLVAALERNRLVAEMLEGNQGGPSTPPLAGRRGGGAVLRLG